MTPLGREPRVIKLAHELGLPIEGNCLAHVTEYALTKVRGLLAGFDLRSMDDVRRYLSSRLSVRIEFIECDGDVARIATNCADFVPPLSDGRATTLLDALVADFLEGDTEGALIPHQAPQPGDLRYLAVVDARGSRRYRAHFTLWHELTHVVVLPENQPVRVWRRAPTPDRRKTDPVERAIDYVAGLLGFFEPFYRPALGDAVMRAGGRLTFTAIEEARAAVVPQASFYAAAKASIRMAASAVAFLRVEYDYKAAEHEELNSGQFSLGDLRPAPEPELRVIDIAVSESATSSRLAIHRKMRVPARSVLARAYTSPTDVYLDALEDQGWWETRGRGNLPTRRLRVQSIRRGQMVYGLVEA
jgi:hypothetical protein